MPFDGGAILGGDPPPRFEAQHAVWIEEEDRRALHTKGLPNAVECRLVNLRQVVRGSDGEGEPLDGGDNVGHPGASARDAFYPERHGGTDTCRGRPRVSRAGRMI
jgi:hypothetical protein